MCGWEETKRLGFPLLFLGIGSSELSWPRKELMQEAALCHNAGFFELSISLGRLPEVLRIFSVISRLVFRKSILSSTPAKFGNTFLNAH